MNVHGLVIAIGGNEEKRVHRASILRGFVSRAGGPSARLIVIPSASVEPVRRARQYHALFTRLGAGSVQIVHAERGVTAEEREAIRNATGIFATGGEQARLMEALRQSDLIEPIHDAVRRGAVFAGTSAGAAAVSARMIAGEDEQGTVEYGYGLGLLRDVIIDQHFAERQRLARLQAATQTHGLLGVGIDENTAVLWDGRSGEISVEGVGTVTIVDGPRLHVLRDGARWPAR